MRVAQIMAGALAGGAELFFERLTGALVRAGETVLPVIRRDAARAAKLRAAGIEPVQFGFGSPLDFVTRPRIATALRQFGPRVAVAWMSRAARFTPPGSWVLVGRLGGFYDLRYFRHCDHLAGNTHGLVEWITRQGWPASRVHYLPNFVTDLAGVSPVSRASLGVPDGAPMLLALGRLHSDKAFDVLIRALPRLAHVHLVIAGEGPGRASLVALARRHGVADRLHLIGWRNDTGALLAAADALVCPSRIEPLGNVVLEAWSARRPIVAASSDGPRELIAHGQTGLLVQPEDHVGLANALAVVLEDRARAAALADAGRARYEACFAEAPVVAHWRRFLASVEKP
jgi:glycosyltransferase involved in cell wall biosynthesis